MAAVGGKTSRADAFVRWNLQLDREDDNGSDSDSGTGTGTGTGSRASAASGSGGSLASMRPVLIRPTPGRALADKRARTSTDAADIVAAVAETLMSAPSGAGVATTMRLGRVATHSVDGLGSEQSSTSYLRYRGARGGVWFHEADGAWRLWTDGGVTPPLPVLQIEGAAVNPVVLNLQLDAAAHPAVDGLRFLCAATHAAVASGRLPVHARVNLQDSSPAARDALRALHFRAARSPVITLRALLDACNDGT
jgi:hypothetical protein